MLRPCCVRSRRMCCRLLNTLLVSGLRITQLTSVCKVERVQRKFTKRLLGCSKLSYADRLARLKLESLKVRRLRHDLILTYNILSGLSDMNQSDFLTFADRTHSIRGHAYKLLLSHC